MEARLKEDIIREAEKYNNLVLVHDEIENGRIVPSWISLGEIQTPKEVFDQMTDHGYRVSYLRIPISPEQAPEDSYLDEFVNVVKKTSLDDPLVFNCGMGVGRSMIKMKFLLFQENNLCYSNLCHGCSRSLSSGENVSYWG